MKALVYSAVREVTMQERPVPTPSAGQVRLKVQAVGICGSDMAGFLGHSPRRKPPLILGHEIVGTIDALPENTGLPFALGQRVTVNPFFPCGQCAACASGDINLCIDWKLLGMDKTEGAFADYVLAPANHLYAVPENLPHHKAVMVEPLANGVHLFNLMRRPNPPRLAIFGAGTQGCLLTALAVRNGCKEIAVVDVNAERLAVAQTLGATQIINARETDPVAALRNLWADGADAVIDAHGSQLVRDQSVKSVKKGGEVLLLGLHEVQTTLDFTAIVRNEIRLQGSFAYNAADFAQALELIANDEIDLSAWTETLPLEQGQAAFDRLTTDPGATMKIVLTP
jgi:2-desacetyl-2-hydroxyethyl bacteriochlorophyllide A dehydrogenase